MCLTRVIFQKQVVYQTHWQLRFQIISIFSVKIFALLLNRKPLRTKRRVVLQAAVTQEPEQQEPLKKLPSHLQIVSFSHQELRKHKVPHQEPPVPSYFLQILGKCCFRPLSWCKPYLRVSLGTSNWEKLFQEDLLWKGGWGGFALNVAQETQKTETLPEPHPFKSQETQPEASAPARELMVLICILMSKERWGPFCLGTAGMCSGERWEGQGSRGPAGVIRDLGRDRVREERREHLERSKAGGHRGFWECHCSQIPTDVELSTSGAATSRPISLQAGSWWR